MNSPREHREGAVNSIRDAAPRQRLVWVEEGRWLVFDDGTAGHYDVNLEQFADPCSEAEWFEHLERKRWFSPEHKRQAFGILNRNRDGR